MESIRRRSNRRDPAEAEAGQKVDKICRAHGIAKPTVYHWKGSTEGCSSRRRTACGS